MLEGKELDKKLGEYGSVFVDVNDKLVVEVGVAAKVDLYGELKKVADKSGNKIFIGLVGLIGGFIGKDEAPPA